MQRKKQNIFISIIFIILVIALTNFLYRTIALKHLDSVFLFESSQSILESGHPTSNSVASWPVALSTFSISSDALCKSDLSNKNLTPYNVIDNHAYLALYPISILTLLLGPELSFASINALSHLLLLIIPFIFLRKLQVGFLLSFIFSLCVALYPAWSYSAIGDYYLDRIYMPFALIALYTMHLAANRDIPFKDSSLIASLVIFICSAAIFTERAAIMMMGAVFFFFCFFSRIRENLKFKVALFALFAIIAAYLFLYFKYFFIGIDGAGSIFANALTVLRNPTDRFAATGLKPFILVNLFFLGFFILFSGIRYILLAIGAIIPNILISVGGAELNGWSTHYHSMYLPFVVFSASIGFLKLARHLTGKYIYLAYSSLIFIYVISIAAALNPFTGNFERPLFYSLNRGILGTSFDYYIRPEKSNERVAIKLMNSLDEIIPSGVKISAIEGVMPALYKSRSLSLYPINMDDSDYLVISGVASSGSVTSASGANSHLGQLQVDALNKCLLTRIYEKNFSFMKEIPQIGILIFQKK